MTLRELKRALQEIDTSSAYDAEELYRQIDSVVSDYMNSNNNFDLEDVLCDYGDDHIIDCDEAADLACNALRNGGLPDLYSFIRYLSNDDYNDNYYFYDITYGDIEALTSDHIDDLISKLLDAIEDIYEGQDYIEFDDGEEPSDEG